MFPPLLFDEGLPHQVAKAFATLGLMAHAVGDGDAPAFMSSDTANCEWCAERGAMLVTNDRGKGDKEIRAALAATGIDALFVFDDLRAAPSHELARALLLAEHRIAELGSNKKPIRRRLKPSGRLEKIAV